MLIRAEQSRSELRMDGWMDLVEKQLKGERARRTYVCIRKNRLPSLLACLLHRLILLLTLLLLFFLFWAADLWPFWSE